METTSQHIEAARSSWTFDGVADRFEGHIESSVPYYRGGHDLICRFCDFFLRPDSVVYDIGSSTGALARRLLEWNQGRPALRYIGLDPVQGMVDHAREETRDDHRATYLVEDIVTYQPGTATVFVCYYTLQFVHPAHRQAVLDKIYRSLEWGGALFLFEKVRGPDARFQDYASQLYAQFKVDQGFSPDEIYRKAESLKGVLEPFSSRGNLDLLGRAGFVDIATIYKWVTFEGWLAIK